MKRLTHPTTRVLLVVILILLVAPTVSACGASEDHASWTAAPAAAHTSQPMTATEAAWKARPAYVSGHPQVEEAYAYALANPMVLQWLPCYCGCAAMDHRSNLDCFFKPTAAGLVPEFEEHASYCDVCVETALMAKEMQAGGQGMRAIRDRVDATFGGRAPGTVTPLPPA